MTIYVIAALIASIISIVSLIPYIKDIISKQTKPHIFTWFVWTLMTGIFFFAQLSDGAGIGALTSGITTILCIIILVLSFKQGDKMIVKSDWLSFVLSLIALLAWALTKSPFYSVIFITISDIIAYIPTVRKSFKEPYSETLSTHLLSGVKHFINVFSLQNITFISSFYTICLIFINFIFVTFLIIRRKAVKKES